MKIHHLIMLVYFTKSHWIGFCFLLDCMAFLVLEASVADPHGGITVHKTIVWLCHVVVCIYKSFCIHSPSLTVLFIALIQHKIQIYPGWGHLSFNDMGLCHSNRGSTIHKSGEISEKYTHKSRKGLRSHNHKSGNTERAHQQIKFYRKQ